MSKWLKNRDFIGGSILLVFSVWFYFTAQTIPKGNVSGMPPSFFPSFLAIILGILSFIVVIKGIKQILAGSQLKIERKNHKNVFLLFLLLIAYLFAFQHLGFIVTTIIYLILVMLLLKAGKLVKIVPISIIITLAVYYIFGVGFKIPLP
ncbi:MAG: Tripartite tricarboxylate transporter TctB family [Clostridia bacterium]|nr:Tripartite tricarboxylate transporter TctB family [Clostridia bacterium]